MIGEEDYKVVEVGVEEEDKVVVEVGEEVDAVVEDMVEVREGEEEEDVVVVVEDMVVVRVVEAEEDVVVEAGEEEDTAEVNMEDTGEVHENHACMYVDLIPCSQYIM